MQMYANAVAICGLKLAARSLSNGRRRQLELNANANAVVVQCGWMCCKRVRVQYVCVCGFAVKCYWPHLTVEFVVDSTCCWAAANEAKMKRRTSTNVKWVNVSTWKTAKLTQTARVLRIRVCMCVCVLVYLRLKRRSPETTSQHPNKAKENQFCRQDTNRNWTQAWGMRWRCQIFHRSQAKHEWNVHSNSSNSNKKTQKFDHEIIETTALKRVFVLAI